MVRHTALFIFIIFLFAGCKKENPDQQVTFTVVETSALSPVYTISYTSDKIGTTTIASSSVANWKKENVVLRKGQFVSLKVECTEPSYAIQLSVFVDGFLWKRMNMNNPTPAVTLSGTP